MYIEDLKVCATERLSREEETVLSKRVRAGLTQAALLVLRSPVTVRELRGWDELITLGEMSPKELMPRGRRTSRELREMRRAVRDVVSFLRRKERKDRFSRLSEDDRNAVYDRIVALDLSETKVRRLAGRIKELAAAVGAAPGAAPAKRLLAAYDIPASDLFALDVELRRVEADVEQAKGTLVAANMRLVVSIAKNYRAHSMEFSDLLQEGALGLMMAIDKFDPARGFRFSTYATWWVRQSVTRALSDKERTVRLPVHIREHAARIRKTQKRYFEQTGDDVAMPELARRVRMSTAQINEIMQATQEPVSLSMPMSDEDEGGLEAILPETGSPSHEVLLQKRLRSEATEKLLSRLSPREADVLRCRFGISLDRSCSLSEVGRKYGLSRERVRQIERDALLKLRVDPGSVSARDYL